MSIFIDRTFLLRISPRLERFTRKSEDLYNFRCPICGDSHKNKTKTRGYVYRKKNDYFYRCHNCGLSTTFYNFLKQIAPVLCKEYTLERYKNGETHNHNYTKPEFEELKTLPVFKKKLDLPSIESLQEEHFAKQYVLNRKIPKSFMSELYFAEDFKKFVISVGIEKDLHNNDQRLVIPFYNKDGHLIAFQGRALGESSIRYITIKLNGDDPKAFGLNRIDEKEMIYVMEGPIDSMFIKNSVAMANSNLEGITDFYDKSKVVLVFDNEPRNKEIINLMNHAIDNHFNVVIWPEMIIEKDVNDMIIKGYSSDDLEDIIEKNTFVNLRAKMEFINWKKM